VSKVTHLPSQVWHLLPREASLRVKGSFVANRSSPLNSQLKKGIAKKQKAKGNGNNNIARMKCYNCDKKGNYIRNCPKPSKAPFPTKNHDIYVCSLTFVANSLPQWIVDTGTTKHIV